MESKNYWICILSIWMYEILKISFHCQKVKINSRLWRSIFVVYKTMKQITIQSFHIRLSTNKIKSIVVAPLHWTNIYKRVCWIINSNFHDIGQNFGSSLCRPNDIEDIYHLRFYHLFFDLFFIEYHEVINSFLLPFKIGGGGIESKKHIQKRFQKQFDLIVSPLSPSNYVETWLPGLS